MSEPADMVRAPPDLPRKGDGVVAPTAVRRIGTIEDELPVPAGRVIVRQGESCSGVSVVTHGALLESAVAAPQATWGGEPIMIDPHEIAAAYLFYLCRSHAFVDKTTFEGINEQMIAVPGFYLLDEQFIFVRQV